MVPDRGDTIKMFLCQVTFTIFLFRTMQLLAIRSKIFRIIVRHILFGVKAIALLKSLKVSPPKSSSVESHYEASDEKWSDGVPSVVTGVVGGRGFSDVPTIQSTKGWATNLPSETRDLLMQSIVLNSTAFEVLPEEGGGFKGCERETALLGLARSHLGMGHVQETRDEFNVVCMMPFDSSKRFMGTMIKLPHSSGYRLFLKGDPRALLGYCTEKSDFDAASRSPLTDADREDFERTIEAYSQRSLSPFGLVYKDVLPTEAGAFPSEGIITSTSIAESHDLWSTRDRWVTSTMHNMTFLGLFGINRLHQSSQAMVDIPKKSLRALSQSPRPKSPTPSKNMSSPAFEWHVLGELNGKTIEALADTGANCNAISESCASERNLTQDPGSTRARIRLPSGRYCMSLGTTTLQFRFDGEDEVHNVECNIVPKLKQACVLALGFLRTTETLTNFKSRLKEVPLPRGHRMSLRLMRDRDVGSDINNDALAGYIAGGRCLAMPDSGSSIMALSGPYVRGRQMRIDRRKRCKVKFIDGSSAWTSGTVTAPWQFRRSRIPFWDILYFILYFLLLKPFLPHARPPWMVQEWHVIENMDVDAVLSIDFIKEHDIFRAYESSFVTRLKSSDTFAAKIYGICPYPEGNKRLETLASSFYSDSKSYSNPEFPCEVWYS